MIQKSYIIILIIFLSSCSSNATSSSQNYVSSNETVSSSNIVVEKNTPQYEVTDPLSTESTDYCKIPAQKNNSVYGVSVGFPLSENRINNKGVVNVQVIFLDFPDLVGARTKEQLIDFVEVYKKGVKDFFDNQSQNRVSFNWRIYSEFIRIPEMHSSLYLNGKDADKILRKGIAISDTVIDYTDIDMVAVIVNPDEPRELVGYSAAWPLISYGIETDEKTIFNATFLASNAKDYTVVHEIGHLFGLADLYKYDWLEDNPNRDPKKKFEYLGLFDFMNEPVRNPDMLGWQKWQLSWIEDEKVICLDATKENETIHLLTSFSNPGDGNKIIVVKISENKVIIAEKRSKNRYCQICSGNIYFYTVDSTIASGNGPIKLIRPTNSKFENFEDAYISQDQELIFENIKFKVLYSDDDKTYISIIIE
jgi:M6 family metalloprotease-like protein